MSLDERSWETIALESVLLNAVSNWREDPDKWLSHSVERLSETVRVNPLRNDKEWTENWLEINGGKKIDWFSGVGSAWILPFERGKAEDDVKIVLSALHETGRLTRQEAVSMIPAIFLDASSSSHSRIGPNFLFRPNKNKSSSASCVTDSLVSKFFSVTPVTDLSPSIASI